MANQQKNVQFSLQSCKIILGVQNFLVVVLIQNKTILEKQLFPSMISWGIYSNDQPTLLRLGNNPH